MRTMGAVFVSLLVVGAASADEVYQAREGADFLHSQPEFAAVGLAHSIEEWERNGRTQRLAPGEHVVSKPIVLGHTDVLRGSGRNTILVAGKSLPDAGNPPAMIVSEDYERHRITERNGWTYQGVPMAIQISDLTLEGVRVSDNPGMREKGKPDRLHGILLCTGAARISNVLVHNIPGTAIDVYHHSPPRKSWAKTYDMPETVIRDVWVHNVYRGVKAGGADGVVDNLSVCRCRDTGLDAGAAWNIALLHAYGCGVGLHTRHQCYGGIVQAENCNVGWINDGSNSLVSIFRAFGCRTAAKLNKKATFGIKDVDVMDGGKGITGKAP